MLKAHRNLTYGVHIISPALHRKIKHHSIAFADDTEGQVSSETTEEISAPRVVKQLQHSGQTWSNLANICGGLIAHHKCCWQFMSWENKSGHLVLHESAPEKVVLQDGKGAHVEIKYLPPDEPNVGLGFNLCISGIQTPHFNATMEKMRIICTAAATAHLTETEMRSLVLSTRLLPKLAYALHGTTFSKKQCNSINSLIHPSILPQLRLNQHYPSALLYGPIDYGGMEFPDAYTLQDKFRLIISSNNYDGTRW